VSVPLLSNLEVGVKLKADEHELIIDQKGSTPI